MDKLDEHDGRPFDRVQVLKLGFDQLTREMAVAYLWAWPSDAAYGYVTTPNVDHLVRLRTERHTQEVEEAYDACDLTLCDSKVMALLSRWYGVSLPVATGSDVTEDLLDRLAGSDDPLLIIGGGPETAQQLAEERVTKVERPLCAQRHEKLRTIRVLAGIRQRQLAVAAEDGVRIEFVVVAEHRAARAVRAGVAALDDKARHDAVKYCVASIKAARR